MEETLVAGASVARVAQRHGVNANQVFQWRRMYQSGLLGGIAQDALKLLPVRVTKDEELPKVMQAEVAVSRLLRVRFTSSCARAFGSAWKVLLIWRSFAWC